MDHRRTTKILTSYDENSWRFSYLRQQFRLSELEGLFEQYLRRVNNAYFTLFLILLVFINGGHFLVVLFSNMSSLHIVWLDLTIYGVVAVVSLLGVFLVEAINKKYPFIFKLCCFFAFILFYAVNLVLPVYHAVVDDYYFRTAYTTHLIIACYVFLTIKSTLNSVVLGIIVTGSSTFVLAFFGYAKNYKDSEEVFFRRVGSDTVYFICINCIGIYFRVMNELVQRRGFLDRRECVQSNLDLISAQDLEDQLLTSILPRNIIDKVKDKFVKEGNKIPKLKPFDGSYLTVYDNVTILYADIVNYTQMTTKLKPVTKLVETLNDLFGSFDDASEELKVMRIKFLGDCYYCVAGLPPDCIHNHAEACVDLGLRMIQIIKNIRQTRDLDIDMRIGVHTGSIIGGIIGTSKWQYDVWSKDVLIANRMETTGRPGKVHITKQTRDQLRKEYNLATADVNDEMLQSNEIQETFLISPRKITPVPVPDYRPGLIGPNSLFDPIIQDGSVSFETGTDSVNLSVRRFNRTCGNPRARFSVMPRSSGRLNGGNRMNRGSTENLLSRRTAFMDNNIKRFHKTLEETNNTLKKCISEMPLSKYDQWFKVTDINPFLLLFKNKTVELQYILQPDPLFKYYLLIELLILISIIAIQAISKPKFEWTTLLEILTIFTIIFVLLPLTWTHYVWNSRQQRRMADEEVNDDNNNDDESISDESIARPKSILLKFLDRSSELITRNVYLRTIIYLVLCLIFTFCIFSEMTHCEYQKVVAPKSNEVLLTNVSISKASQSSSCVIPWHMTETCLLVIAMNFLFLRINAWLKLIVSVCITAMYSLYILFCIHDYYDNSDSYNPNVKPQVAHIMAMVSLTFTLHFINRQSDYMDRLDHKWNQQLIKEEEEASVIRANNYSLLKNILPIHVVNHFLNVNRNTELYYEEYTDVDVAVMFASIVNYKPDSLPPMNFVKVMDQIISDFDGLLYKDMFKMKVEKIKLANWTYMAACGLVPGRKNNEAVENEETTGEAHIVTLLKFAVGMRKLLKRANAGNFQNFQLRIGICHGELTAGVVGSKKPLYDIWGDTVNMASRMDSTGEANHIQVTENTAMALKKNKIKCKFRDYIFVKGKSKNKEKDVPTYYVCLDDKDELIYEENDDN